MAKDHRITNGATGGAAVKLLRGLNAPIIHVTVTQHIIDESVRKHSGYCMISEAVKLAAPWAKNVATDIQTVRLTDPRKGLRYTYLTPRVAQDALIRFDTGGSQIAFKFKLKGAHIGTSFKRSKTPSGGTAMKPVHKLGKRRIIETSASRKGAVPDTIGGQAMPRMRPPSVSFRREYGLRQYVSQFDLNEMGNAKVPVGAPSISDKA